MIRGGAKSGGVNRLQQLGFKLPWQAITLLLRIFYGFRIEGADRLPNQGPYILVHNELSPMSFLMTGWIDILAMGQAFGQTRETMTFLREERMNLPFFRSVINSKTPGKYAALAPSGSGRLALGLLEAVHILQNGGVVVLYPEGDMTWDGRPSPLGHALAWLGLHSAAPIVPALATIGAYDIWPRWETRMHITGRMSLKIGEPMRLCQEPSKRVTEQDIAEAEDRLRRRFEIDCYGPGGIQEWSGVPTVNGDPAKEPFGRRRRVSLPRRSGIQKDKPSKRGIGFLLWRCPVCHSEDALIHSRPVFGRQSVQCQSCNTHWSVSRKPGRDIRLRVTECPLEFAGLEMALSAWYDEIRCDLSPEPISSGDLELGPGEHPLLSASAISLASRPLVSSIETPGVTTPQRTGVEPVRAELADWDAHGDGRLMLTTDRLIWRSANSRVDIWWHDVSLITLWLWGSLTAVCRRTAYRFELGQENGLKWLAYCRVQAQQMAARTGRKITVSPF